MKNIKKINLRAQLLHAASGAWLFNDSTPKFYGTPQQIFIAFQVASATKRFNEELENKSATVESVINFLQKKHLAAAKFEKEFGTKWLF